MKTVNINDESLTNDVTLEEAKTFDCCIDLSEEEILKLLNAIIGFTEVAFEAFAIKQQKEKKEEENGDYKMAA